jgi:hypothetical protein
MRMLQGPLGALLVLAVLVWLGMAVSVATMLRKAGVPPARAYLVCLAVWPLVLRRVRELRGTADTEMPGSRTAAGGE